MLRRLSNIILGIYLFLQVGLASASEAVLKLPNDKNLVLKEFYKVHRVFFKKTCTPKLERKYYQLLRDYRGNGYHLPELNGKIDVDTIKKFIPLLRLKKRWTTDQKNKIKKMKKWPYFKTLTNNLVQAIERAQKLKKKHFLSVDDKVKLMIIQESQKQVELIKKYFSLILNEIPFLLSFQHPVDHLLNRGNYADIKHSDKAEDQKRANEIFFVRRILEDGAMDQDHTRSDKFLRSTIDTLTLNIPKMIDFLDENIRYDLDYVIRSIQKQLKRGKRAHLKRFEAWEDRTVKTLLFYKKIIQNDKISHRGELNENDKLLAEKLKANEALKKFVYENQRDTYLFWKKQSTKNKALFAIETILYNEVGAIDGKDGLERIDVAKVVRNRVFEPEYRYIPSDQDLYKYLNENLTDEEIQNEYWLNVLFKEGEFSFTYFYISGVVKIFCPDMSSQGRYLRKKNLKIAMDILDRPMDDFSAVRYFSRAAMNGRIDMSAVWSEFVPVAERPGLKISSQNKLRRFFMSDNYEYLYNFTSEGRVYQVLLIRDDIVVMTWEDKKPTFYNYRNPHYFKYFTKSVR